MEELCPFFVYEIAVGLQRVMDGLIDAVVRDVAGEVPEELEPASVGSPPWNAKVTSASSPRPSARSIRARMVWDCITP